MSSRGKKKKIFNQPKSLNSIPKTSGKIQVTNSLLDIMEDGKEFESILQFKAVNIEITTELRKVIDEIESIRGNPLICYVANVVNTQIKASISIDNTDDLPFSEMISLIPDNITEIDILIVTPGGSGQQVAKFVDRLRPRFKNVNFIIPNMAMSAGTIFAMSGNDIIMTSRSYIGPIDPQIPNRDGHYIPAQAILTLIDAIQKRGEELIEKGQPPQWTDLQILRQIEGKEIGNAINASNYSVELVETFLYKYKFCNWEKHSDGRIVSDEEKKNRAHDIADRLCKHSLWKTHNRGISRESAWEICQLKITHSESIGNLDRSIRRFWALTYWICENTPIFKFFISKNYCILRHDISLIEKRQDFGKKRIT